MAEHCTGQEFPKLCEAGVFTMAASGMASETTHISGRRVSGWDQLALNMSAMQGKELSQMSQASALGYRTATESGSGATRVWSNPPEGGGGT